MGKFSAPDFLPPDFLGVGKFSAPDFLPPDFLGVCPEI
jgi:hypothetical protein